MIDRSAAELEQELIDFDNSFLRKLRGAQDALEHSSDPVSQSANSIVELVDRILRTAFGKDEVVDWIIEQMSERFDELTYPKGPTKLGESLCFVYAGGEVGSFSPIHEVLARAIVELRTQMQKLKHSDRCSEEEVELANDGLAALRMLLWAAMTYGWRVADPERVSSVKVRLSA